MVKEKRHVMTKHEVHLNTVRLKGFCHLLFDSWTKSNKIRIRKMIRNNNKNSRLNKVSSLTGRLLVIVFLSQLE